MWSLQNLGITTLLGLLEARHSPARLQKLKLHTENLSFHSVDLMYKTQF